jgi:RimJ/RimL family protein N-acetyltransferase
MNREKITNTISTPRLTLVNATVDIIEHLVLHEKEFGVWLDINIADPWTEFGAPPFQYALGKIVASPGSEVWWSWLPIHKEENRLIGNCGYKGPPDNGTVEIGYEVAKDYRRKGFATEMAQALITNAFAQPGVHTILAHTLAEENTSVRVLRKCGFAFITAMDDPHDGQIWQWRLLKDA